MRIHRLIVSPWRSNCYLVSADDTASECIVVDPGITAAEPLFEALHEASLTPVAVLGTHGHVDHVGDAHQVAARFQVPVFLAAEDQHQLTRPGAGLGPHGDAIVTTLLGTPELPAVDDVRSWTGPLHLAGLSLDPFAAPGHTEGSTLLSVSAGQSRAVFTGDVLFAGSIGRIDLPGGSMSAMRETLRRIIECFPPEVALLPGHGEPTTLARELATNPYLQPEF